MNGALKTLAITTALVAFMAGSALSVAAAPMPDGAYSMLTAGTYGRGLAVVSYTGTTTVNAGMVGLISSQEYFLIGRSITCNGQPTSANRVFRLSVTTGDGGDFFTTRAIAINGIVRSIWVVPSDGSEPAVCSLTLNFEYLLATGNVNGDGAVGFMLHTNVDRLALAVVEKLPNGQARASIVLNGLSGNDDYRVQGVGTKCGHSFDPGQRYYAYELKNVQVTSFKSKTVPMSQNQLDSLRSVRIKDTTDGTKWGCVPLSLIGILIG